MRKDPTPGPTPLSPTVLYILLALADQDRHGYGIMQEINASTQGQTCLGAGTLYGTLKRMIDAGLIQEVSTTQNPSVEVRRRRYYSLTTLGRQVAKAEVVRLSRLLTIAQSKRLIDQKP